MCNSLDGILNGMGKIIHGINAPRVARVMMGHMSHPVNNGITHIHIRRRHINTGPQNFLPVPVHPVFHIFEQFQILLHAPFRRRVFLSRLRQGSPVFPDLIRAQIGYISFSFFNQRNRRFIHLPEIIGCKEQTVFPVCAKPLNIRFNRLYKFRLFLCRIGIVKTHIELAAVLFCKTIIQKNTLGVPDMQISVRFGRKTGVNRIINALRQIFIDDLLDKITTFFNFTHDFTCLIFLF